MNIKALKESLNEAKEAKKAILNGAITEFRSLEDTENEELRHLDEKIVELQKEIEKAEEEVRSTSVEKTIENKGEIKMEKTQIELREQFMNALATPNADVSKLEMRGAGDGYTAGLGDTPYDATNKGQMNVSLTIEGAIRNAIDFNSDVLGLANVIRTNGTHRIVLDASPASEARLVKEGASISSIDSEFVKVELGAYKYGEIVKFTREVVEDVNFNIVAHAGQRLGMAFAKAFEKAIITGTGSGQPEGLLSATPDNSDMQKASKQVTAKAGAISANDVVASYYNLPHECRQNAVFVCHPDTVKALAMLQDANGRQLLTDGLEPGVRTLMGCRVIECAYMPKLGTQDAKVGMFVDVKRALTVGVRSDVQVRQLHELYAVTDMVALVATARMDAKVVQAGAISYIVAGATE
nr:MAG TPA: major capsid protein [Bacteriophage sp.]